METKKITIKDKEIVVKEVLFTQAFDVDNRKKIEDDGYQKVMLQLSTGLTDDEYNLLGMRDGMKLWRVFTELNETEDFQNPQVDNETSEQP